MKGVILAGGLGTRLYPLTRVTNKHLLPVFNKPMIFYPVATLVNAGITEIMVVTGGPHCGEFLSILKNGKELGISHLEFAYQETEGGIADALRLARDFASGDNIAVILGDNTTDYDIRKDVENFTEGAKVFLKEVPDPERFGIPEFDGDKITRIVEKPKNPSNNLAVIGLYLYDKGVFDFISQVKPSARGEMEITDVNNFYAKSGQLSYKKISGFWRDAGTFETLLEANVFWSRKK